MAFSRLHWWVGACLGVGCAPSLEIPKTDQTLSLEVSPPLVHGVTSRSIRVTGSSSESPRLFEGNVTARQVGSLSRGETLASLAERELELVRAPATPRDGDAGAAMSDAAQIWIPKRLLDAATEYSVVAGTGHVAFTTLPDEPALLRVWPADPVVSQALYCLEASTSYEPLANCDEFEETTAVVFGDARAALGAGWTQLAHTPPCWLWQGTLANANAAMGETTLDAGPIHLSFAVSPRLPGAAVEPTWVVEQEGEVPESTICYEHEQALGFGCAVVEDDRLFVRGGESLWRVAGDAEGWFVLGEGRTGVVRGLKPDARQTLIFTVYFQNAASRVYTSSVTMGSVRPHIVINEVMADPLGNEPDQEWIELYNDGAAPVNLEGWVLKDESGEMTLPDVWLAPSGYALLVNDTYVSNAAGEPVPEPNALVVRLPALGKSGLSNGGEALRLVDKSDMVVASFPATPKPTPGVSVARGAPWQVDEPSAFGQHGLPGASPGSANRLRLVVAGKQ